MTTKRRIFIVEYILNMFYCWKILVFFTFSDEYICFCLNNYLHPSWIMDHGSSQVDTFKSKPRNTVNSCKTKIIKTVEVITKDIWNKMLLLQSSGFIQIQINLISHWFNTKLNIFYCTVMQCSLNCIKTVELKIKLIFFTVINTT